MCCVCVRVHCYRRFSISTDSWCFFDDIIKSYVCVFLCYYCILYVFDSIHGSKKASQEKKVENEKKIHIGSFTKMLGIRAMDAY